MFKFQAKSLATKLIAVTGGTIALVLLASNFVLISQTQDRVETEFPLRVHPSPSRLTRAAAPVGTAPPR